MREKETELRFECSRIFCTPLLKFLHCCLSFSVCDRPGQTESDQDRETGQNTERLIRTQRNKSGYRETGQEREAGIQIDRSRHRETGWDAEKQAGTQRD